MLSFLSQKTRLLEAIPLISARVLPRDLLDLGCQFELVEREMLRMSLELRATIFGGETRETVKTVEMRQPKTWVDSLQLHAQSKGWLCGGGIIGLLLYWWFLDRTPQWMSTTYDVRFRARELFPTIRASEHRCVIADWTDVEPMRRVY